MAGFPGLSWLLIWLKYISSNHSEDISVAL